MKLPSLKLLLLFPVLWFPAIALAQTGGNDSPELRNAHAAYAEQLATAIKPIQTRYITYLQSLLKSLTQKGDLKGALSVQKELDKYTNASAPDATGKLIEPPSILSRFNDSKWKNDDGDSRIEFKSGGDFHEQWNKDIYTGTWKSTSEYEIEVSRNDGKIYHFKLDPVKDKFFRSEGSIGWNRIK